MSEVYGAFLRGHGDWAVGELLSGDGIGDLALKVRGPGVEVELFSWRAGLDRILANRILALPETTKVVIGGTSLGGNETPSVCTMVYPRKVDFIFACQPSLYGRKIPVPGNVDKALCVYAPLWAIWTLGYGSHKWTYKSDRTQQQWLTSFMHHPGDNDPRVHAAVLKEFARLRA